MSTDPAEAVEPARYLERFDPAGRTDPLATEHLARYAWACQFLPAQRVLDCSCGPGYGSAMLRDRGAGQVIGVDLSAEAVEYAREHYRRSGVEYVVADAFSLTPAQRGRFDLIVSLETIEHVPEPERLLDVFQALLADDGVLALSCPNDAILGEHNPYHLWRADLARFDGWLRARFGVVVPYNEIHTVGTLVCPSGVLQGDSAPQIGTRFIDRLPANSAPGFLFACAQRRPLPAVPCVAAELLNGFGYIRQLMDANRWLEGQRVSWEKAAADYRTANAELQNWLAQLQEARTWLDTQVRQYQGTVEQQESMIAQLRGWTEELEKARNWLAAQQQQHDTVIAELQGWVRELEKSKAWLEEQRQHGQVQIADQEKVIAELHGWVRDLEQSKAGLDEERRTVLAQLDHQRTEEARIRQVCANWKQQRLFRVLRRLRLLHDLIFE